jgi:SPP1 gp7 family putative phage head morphogenesis protein
MELMPLYEIGHPNDIIPLFKDFTSTKAFDDYTLASASKMVTGLMEFNAQTWKEAASKSMRGKMIYQSLQNELHGPVGFHMRQLIEHNAQLISTFPETIAKQVNKYIAEESLKGKRASEITKQLVTQFPEVTKNRLALIARTETSKTSTELTRVRAENLNIQWYVWKTSKDQRVRPSHKLMDGVLCSWQDPPNPEALDNEKAYGNYAPGDTFNCRCYPAPLVDYDDVSWPHKVYAYGRISYMTFNIFKSLGIIEYRMAA